MIPLPAFKLSLAWMEIVIFFQPFEQVSKDLGSIIRLKANQLKKWLITG